MNYKETIANELINGSNVEGLYSPDICDVLKRIFHGVCIHLDDNRNLCSLYGVCSQDPDRCLNNPCGEAGKRDIEDRIQQLKERQEYEKRIIEIGKFEGMNVYYYLNKGLIKKNKAEIFLKIGDFDLKILLTYSIQFDRGRTNEEKKKIIKNGIIKDIYTLKYEYEGRIYNYKDSNKKQDSRVKMIYQLILLNILNNPKYNSFIENH